MDTLRLIHTADIHLDRSFAGQSLAAPVATQKREALRKAFAKVVEDARDADALLIAGDLFDADPAPDTVRFVVDQLAAIAPTPVYITPGNHELWSPSSPFARQQWHSNVYIFTEATPRAIEDPSGKFRVVGFAYTAGDMTRNILAGVEAPREGPPAILLAHTQVMEGGEKLCGPYAPCSREDLAGKNFAYIALGHAHRQFEVLGDPPAWYPGSPEPLGYRSEDGYLVVTISDSGVHVEAKHVASMPYRRFEVACGNAASSSDIVAAIETLADSVLAEVTLTGRVSPTLTVEVEQLQQLTGDKFTNLVIRDRTAVARDYDALAAEPTAAGEFVTEMLARIAASGGEAERKKLEDALEYGIRALEGEDLRVLGT